MISLTQIWIVSAIFGLACGFGWYRYFSSLLNTSEDDCSKGQAFDDLECQTILLRAGEREERELFGQIVLEFGRRIEQASGKPVLLEESSDREFDRWKLDLVKIYGVGLDIGKIYGVGECETWREKEGDYSEIGNLERYLPIVVSNKKVDILVILDSISAIYYLERVKEGGCFFDPLLRNYATSYPFVNDIYIVRDNRNGNTYIRFYNVKIQIPADIYEDVLLKAEKDKGKNNKDGEI